MVTHSPCFIMSTQTQAYKYFNYDIKKADMTLKKIYIHIEFPQFGKGPNSEIRNSYHILMKLSRLNAFMNVL